MKEKTRRKGQEEMQAGRVGAEGVERDGVGRSWEAASA